MDTVFDMKTIRAVFITFKKWCVFATIHMFIKFVLN
jgi:hypothetical protein